MRYKVREFLEKYGDDVIVNGKKTREFLDYTFTECNETTLKVREDEIDVHYVKDKIKKYTCEINNLISKFKRDRHTRQAILQLNATGELPECIVSLHFLCRDSILHCIVYSRSWDIDTKFYTDIAFAKKVQLIIANKLRYRAGNIIFHVGSLHYYYQDSQLQNRS